ncbi:MULTISPECIES: pyrroline-5-carboxylate reductase [unclassified Pseudovibrio]|uniref:pyrroline-5-carboxylate reductase n=2 Tax=Pseudovibrio TaxID=258255 RepID=UPI0007AEA5AA|nr:MULTISPECIES: pyrroline-5-carboxylate reductase [unclassified Pseudovibrio]KZL03672.1 Pyrroline-5-carboxylate reductase [Pseudovibrio sp. W74]KZL09614.1 Pyrroline-5-carboxylate reductase [Pseudovibrio sp. Ad14]
MSKPSQIEQINTNGLVLLGCGKMGSAMLKGWLEAGVLPSSTTVIDPYPSDWLRSLEDHGLSLNKQLPAAPAVCILAVKPQMMGDATPQVVALGGGSTVFISVAAGTNLTTLLSLVGEGSPIIRAMPNTPAAIGRGITALIPNDHCSESNLAMAQELLAAVGQTVVLENESQMDAVTAVSGSGPAYVFHLIECLAKAGAEQGLPEELAMQLAKATVGGAGQLAEDASDDPTQLRINVTSPNGTTAAALDVLMNEEDGMPPLLSRAVAAAKKRSEELA